MKLIQAKNLIGSLLSLAALVALAACQPLESVAASNKASAIDSIEVAVDAVNYMHDWDVEYKLTDLTTNQPVAGAIVGLFEGPGGKNCCISLPKIWQAGMKFKVSWVEGGKDFIKPDQYAKVLEIPRYSAPGDLYVLFYPNQEVELIASSVEPGHADWQGKVKTDAFSACVARLSDKECRKHLPKYRWGTPDFAAAQMRKSCNAKAVEQENKEFPLSIESGAKACAEMLDLCLNKWAISDKKMCNFEYQDDE